MSSPQRHASKVSKGGSCRFVPRGSGSRHCRRQPPGAMVRASPWRDLNAKRGWRRRLPWVDVNRSNLCLFRRIFTENLGQTGTKIVATRRLVMHNVSVGRSRPGSGHGRIPPSSRSRAPPALHPPMLLPNDLVSARYQPHLLTASSIGRPFWKATRLPCPAFFEGLLAAAACIPWRPPPPRRGRRQPRLPLRPPRLSLVHTSRRPPAPPVTTTAWARSSGRPVRGGHTVGRRRGGGHRRRAGPPTPPGRLVAEVGRGRRGRSCRCGPLPPPQPLPKSLPSPPRWRRRW